MRIPRAACLHNPYSRLRSSGAQVAERVRILLAPTRFEGWHEHFERQEEALNCFAVGLSDSARLKVLSRGGVDYSWMLETRQENQWVPDSTTGLFFFPFWRKKVTRYLRNTLINGSPH